MMIMISMTIDDRWHHGFFQDSLNDDRFVKWSVSGLWKSGWNGLRWVEVSNRKEGVALANKWQMDIFIVQFQE